MDNKQQASASCLEENWVWTSQMEVDLLQFFMGSGHTDEMIQGRYPAIQQFFLEAYDIHMDFAGITKRLKHLRKVQKKVLEKCGRPLPRASKLLEEEEGEADSDLDEDEIKTEEDEDEVKTGEEVEVEAEEGESEVKPKEGGQDRAGEE